MGDTVYEVTFISAGQLGGQLRVQQSGELILDRGLASGIEDNYRKWAADPRYKNWITRPEYRNVIGAQAVEGGIQ